MMNSLLTTVVIPTYNRTTWIKDTIDSCLSQDDCSLEIVVVDDGSSTNDTRNVVNQYSNVKYIYQDNSGLGAARNTGLAHANGDFVLFLDDDDWLTPDSISKKVEAISENQDITAVYSDLFLTDSNGKNLATNYDGWNRPLPSGDIYPQLIFNNFIPIHALLWRRQALLDSGGFPKRSGLEDWECLLRVAERGRFLPIDEPLGYYRLHDVNMSRKFQQQVDAYADLHRAIISSPRFAQLPGRVRAQALTKYALKHWVDGDPELGKEFLALALKTDPGSLRAWGLKTLTLFGRPAGRLALRTAWYLRAKMRRRFNLTDYFLQQAGLIPSVRSEGI